MNDAANRLDHGNRVFGLEDVSTHVDAGGALLNRLVRHRQSVLFRQLLSASDNNRNRAAGSDVFKAVFDEIGFNQMSAEFSNDSSRQTEIAFVANHVLSNCGNAENRNAVLVAQVNQLDEVFDVVAFVVGTNADLNRHAGYVHADNFFNVDADAFVDENVFIENGCAGRAAHRNGFVTIAGNAGTQSAASAHEAVGVWNQRGDGNVKAFQTGRRTVGVAVVKRQHNGVTGLGIEHSGQSRLHAPIVLIQSLQKETVFCGWNVGVKILFFGTGVCSWHNSTP